MLEKFRPARFNVKPGSSGQWGQPFGFAGIPADIVVAGYDEKAVFAGPKGAKQVVEEFADLTVFGGGA